MLKYLEILFSTTFYCGESWLCNTSNSASYHVHSCPIIRISKSGIRTTCHYRSTFRGNGVIENISADISSKSITVAINDDNSVKGGLFTIELPRNVIDANTTKEAFGCSGEFTYVNGTPTTPSWSRLHDIDYKIFVTSVPIGNTTIYNGNFDELCARDSRTLTVDYPTGLSIIEYQGTVMIPEFGSSLPVLVMAVAIVGVIGVRVFIQQKKRST